MSVAVVSNWPHRRPRLVSELASDPCFRLRRGKEPGEATEPLIPLTSEFVIGNVDDAALRPPPPPRRRDIILGFVLMAISCCEFCGAIILARQIQLHGKKFVKGGRRLTLYDSSKEQTDFLRWVLVIVAGFGWGFDVLVDRTTERTQQNTMFQSSYEDLDPTGQRTDQRTDILLITDRHQSGSGISKVAENK